MTWPSMSPSEVRGLAPAAFAAWEEVVGAVTVATPAPLMGVADAAVASVLTPAVLIEGSAAYPAALRFAEQMTADVASLTTDQREEALAELGSSALLFVHAVWVADMSTRAAAALTAVFGNPVLDGLVATAPSGAGDAWPAQERFLRQVAMLAGLDPVTSELVRLRGARAHACRLCQSLRNKTAAEAAGGESIFESAETYEDSGLSDAHKVALRAIDAFLWQPMSWPEGLAGDVRRHYLPAAAAELVLDAMRNAANKIAVAFAADAPHVEAGVEFYDIDYATGELRYGLTPSG